jgi:hypothetical protein
MHRVGAGVAWSWSGFAAGWPGWRSRSGVRRDRARLGDSGLRDRRDVRQAMAGALQPPRLRKQSRVREFCREVRRGMAWPSRAVAPVGLSPAVARPIARPERRNAGGYPITRRIEMALERVNGPAESRETGGPAPLGGRKTQDRGRGAGRRASPRRGLRRQTRSGAARRHRAPSAEVDARRPDAQRPPCDGFFLLSVQSPPARKKRRMPAGRCRCQSRAVPRRRLDGRAALPRHPRRRTRLAAGWKFGHGRSSDIRLALSQVADAESPCENSPSALRRTFRARDGVARARLRTV